MKEVFYAAVETGELLGKPIENSYMTDLLQALINSNKQVTSIPIYGDWIEIDTVSDLKSHVTLERIISIGKGI